MPVPCSRNQAIAAEQIEFHPVGAGKGVVGPVSVPFFKPFFEMSVHILPVNGEQIHALIGSIVKPCEMIDAQHIYIDIPPVNAGYPLCFLKDPLQHLLGAEHLVAAAESLDFGKFMVQGFHAQGHGVCVIDDPGLRGKFPDGPGDLRKHGHGAQPPHHPAGTRRVSHGLINPQPFRHMHVHRHLVKGARKNGYHHKIRPCQGLPERVCRVVMPFSHCVRTGGQAVPDGFICPRRLPVNVVQADAPAHRRLQGQIRHKRPRPSPGSSPDVGNLHVLCASLQVFHLNPLLSLPSTPSPAQASP